MTGPTPAFWQARFETQQTGWDRGGPGPHLLQWLDSGELQPCRIAVPGCGNGWDVGELAARGFDVIGLDYTPAAVERAQAHLRLLHPTAADGQPPRARIEQADVLVWQPATPLDAVYEQTCLCALHPDHWTAYADQLWRWIRPGGQLRALFMQRLRANAMDEGRIEGPPYHCDINAMRALFPASRWDWPAPPYAQVPHPNGGHELAVVLTRR
jgi:methyl halide transferase